MEEVKTWGSEMEETKTERQLPEPLINAEQAEEIISKLGKPILNLQMRLQNKDGMIVIEFNQPITSMTIDKGDAKKLAAELIKRGMR